MLDYGITGFSLLIRADKTGQRMKNSSREIDQPLNEAFRLAFSLCVLLTLVFATPADGYAEAADRLSQVRRLYVDSFGTDKGAAEIREQIVRRLRRSQYVQVVSKPTEADAVVRGTERIWVTGHVSLSPRSHGLSQSTFEGFLSAEVVGKNDETLWSYLVTPSNFLWNGIRDDLASQLVTKLVAALKAKDHQEPAIADSRALHFPHLCISIGSNCFKNNIRKCTSATTLSGLRKESSN
jgi:hypothetical protein